MLVCYYLLMNKVRTTIYIDKEKAKELKKKAIDAGVSLSRLLSISASEVTLDQINASVKKLS